MSESVDQIVYIDVGGDLNEMSKVISMYGSEDLLSDNMLRFFVGRAVGYASEKHNSVNILNRVTEKVRESIKAYYYQENNTTEIENKIIATWINLANTIESMVREQLYTSGMRNNKVVVLKTFYDQLVGVICTDYDADFESGVFNNGQAGNR